MELRILQNLFINIGIDIVENQRIAKNMENPKFIQRILSEKEQQIFENIKNKNRKVEFLAGRFSAKESITKALNYKPNFNEMTIKESSVEILPSLKEKLKKILNIKDLAINVSISHERNYTISICWIQHLR